MKKPTKKEILSFRRELAHILRTMVNERGVRIWDDKDVTEYAYGYEDKTIIKYIGYGHTPQSLAEMISM